MQKEKIKKLQQNLLQWYRQNGRENLPWRRLGREDCEPCLRHIDRAYGVFVSEIMLQQTQVKTVLERFYYPFLREFPTLKSLARADEGRILKAWQGLGYYHRARNLKRAAQQCLSLFGGALPRSKKELLSLAGVGDYTAGAIACFAYGEAVSFTDGNIRRVLSRLFALKNPTQKQLLARADLILNAQNPLHHNQALMDLGASLCSAQNARCESCPLCEFCRGKDTPQNYPQRKKTYQEKLKFHLFILEFERKFALLQSQKRLHAGLYNFPFFVPENSPFDAKHARHIASFKHSYTQFKLELEIYHQVLAKKERGYLFKTEEECENLALSGLSLKALKIFKKHNHAL